MNDYEPTTPREIIPSKPGSGATSHEWPVSATMVGQTDRPGASRLMPKVRRGLIVAAALIGSVSGLFVGLGASPSASAAQSVISSSSVGGRQSGTGGGSNARSGPAAGGAIGAVGNVSKSSFTLTTSAGQEVTVNKVSSTKYKKGRTRSRRMRSRKESTHSYLGRRMERRSWPRKSSWNRPASADPYLRRLQR